MTSSPSRLSNTGFLILVPALLAVAAMTFLTTSATIVWDIRWFPLYALSVCLVAVGALLVRLTRKTQPLRASIIPAACLSIMALGYLAGAFNGPFPERTLIYALPVFSALVFGGSLLLSVRPADIDRLTRATGFHLATAGFLGVWCLVSLTRFILQDVSPALELARRLDEAAGGGLFRLVMEDKFSGLRNAHPFGHANYVSGFLLLTLPLLAYGIRAGRSKWIRILSMTALALGGLTLFSTQSRNALAGALVAVVVYMWWSRGRKGVSLRWIAGLVGLGLALFVLSPRLSLSSFSVSPGRLGIWEAATRTGWRYFPFGVGEGMTPEMLQLFSPGLSAVWGGAMQFHQTWLHAWAVGGLPAFLGIAGLTLWLLWALLRPGAIDHEGFRNSAPAMAALAATFLVMWADYQLDIFPIALVLMFHLVVVVASVRPAPVPAHAFWSRWLLLAPAAAFLLAAVRIPDSIASRQQINLAGAAFERHQVDDAVAHYLNAYEAVPEPYALNMAGRVLATDPEKRVAAINLFERSLDLWEPQALAHEFLVGLWMQHDHGHEGHTPEEHREALERALHHADRRAELSPELQGSYLDLARIGHDLGRPVEETESYLLMELLMRGDLLFPATWSALGELERYETTILQKLMETEAPEFPRLQSRIETMQAWLSILNRLPENTSLSSDADEKLEKIKETSVDLQLLGDFCESAPEQRSESLLRFLIYLLERPLPPEAAAAFLAEMEEGNDCRASVLTLGEAYPDFGSWNNAGILARHPYSIPVHRVRAYPDVFGSRILSGSHRLLVPNRLREWWGGKK